VLVFVGVKVSVAVGVAVRKTPPAFVSMVR